MRRIALQRSCGAGGACCSGMYPPIDTVTPFDLTFDVVYPIDDSEVWERSTQDAIDSLLADVENTHER